MQLCIKEKYSCFNRFLFTQLRDLKIIPIYLEIFRARPSMLGFHEKFLSRIAPRNFEVFALSTRVSLILMEEGVEEFQNFYSGNETTNILF